MHKKSGTVFLAMALITAALLAGCGGQVKGDKGTEYEINYEGGGAKQAALLLRSYMDYSMDEDRPINISIDKSVASHETKITPDSITIKGNSEEELKKAVYTFANAYLGVEFAGTNREKVNLSNLEKPRIPESIETENPWMEKREPIITLWNVNSPRGVYVGENVSLRPDVMSYSEDQLYSYVRMMKHLGFTGIQVTDMCSAWAGAGGIEPVHEKIRFMADAAHSMDMDFTLWVWGAEFAGYGWVDDEVTYDPGEYGAARNNPAVQACFEKYYNYYMELADCCDRVIAHFYDPGNLGDANDVAYFSGLLRDKFKGINPDIDFGVSCWVDQFDKNVLVSNLGTDITLYEGMQHNNEERYAPFRQTVNDLGCRLGMWEWNGCEMEIDQLAQMNYQPSILKENYQTLREYDGVKKPEYWSTMDSYHVLNVFSLYCAARLEQDPDADVTELTDEIAELAVGEEYADAFADMLLLIEEARSGYTWNDFFWDNEDYLLKSDRYPYHDIIGKCESLLPVLDEMIDAKVQSNGLPLPIPMYEVLELMRPHLNQIYEFAKFRRDFDKFTKATTPETGDYFDVMDELERLSVPVSEYNCVIGLWGQIEARAQRELIVEWCLANNIEPPVNADYDINRKYRIYQYFCMYQKGHTEPVIQYPPYFQYGAAYNEYDTPRLVNELVDEGIFTKNTEDEGVYLTDWDNYRFAFN